MKIEREKNRRTMNIRLDVDFETRCAPFIVFIKLTPGSYGEEKTSQFQLRQAAIEVGMEFEK